MIGGPFPRHVKTKSQRSVSRSCKVKCRHSEHCPGALCEQHHVKCCCDGKTSQVKQQNADRTTTETTESRLEPWAKACCWYLGQEQQWSSRQSFCPLCGHQGAAKCLKRFWARQPKPSAYQAPTFHPLISLWRTAEQHIGLRTLAH